MRYVIGNSENLLMNNYHRLTLVLAIALALGLAPSAFGADAVKQKTFVVCRKKASKRSWRRRRKTTRTPCLRSSVRKPSPSSNRAIKFPIVQLSSASSNLMRRQTSW